MEIKKTMEMMRGGDFDLHTYGDSHCGTAEEFKVRYNLKCLCSPVLDSRGFLFDQLNIQSFFESIQKTSLSCEQLTIVCLEQLLDHILAENPTCQIHTMELTLSPAPYLASMKHTWENTEMPLQKPTLLQSVSKRLQMVVRAKTNQQEAVPHTHAPSHKHYRFTEPK